MRNPEGLEDEEHASTAMEHAFLAMLTGAMDLTKFNDAYFAEDFNERSGWHGGIKKNLEI